ncbi:WXG100 family type VII secretion target [Mycobacteroides abscessus subsp. massiliense]|uniref:type VII secretion target n=1 Tax=Mycobacteroides abscessus TaxID=36809 RepID=UPI0009A758F8|nr:type VII secretion target [Mycobacteroides abscessus]SLE48164.1 WXG100 family type VII secretion target [Mycobacteroides abscessus subsp. massiliense]
MPSSAEPLNVDPDELRVTADRLDTHASEFLSSHQSSHSRAGQVQLGSGLAGAALPEMLAGWEADGARFGKHFGVHAEGHKTAAANYVRTESGNAGGITDVASGL